MKTESNHKYIKWITITAMFMALNVVMSSFSGPVPGGHLYLNDVVICTAAILLDLPPLVLPQEQRQRLRCGQHGKFRGQCAGNVIAQLQRILSAAAVGVSIPLSLREDLPEASEVFGNCPQGLACPDTL